MSDEKGRVVYPAASFQPPDSCPECLAGVPFDEQGRHAQAAETPWEDLRAKALQDYEDKATATHSWLSVIPRAINFYFDHARTPAPPVTVNEREWNTLGNTPEGEAEAAMKLCAVCHKPFRYPPSDNKADATTCAWCTTPPADVEGSPLPAQELLPCPFCGAPDADFAFTDNKGRNPDLWDVVCRSCFASTDTEISKESAAKNWNTRASDASKDNRTDEEKRTSAIVLLRSLRDVSPEEAQEQKETWEALQKDLNADRDASGYVRELEELLRSLIPVLCDYCRDKPQYPLQQWGTVERGNVGFTHTGTFEHTPCGAEAVHRALISQHSPEVKIK